MQKVLIVDDDKELCELVAEFLEPEGFDVEAVHDGKLGLGKAVGGGHDLIILDIMLPGLNGLDVLRKIRSVSNVPVLLLTARGADLDRIVGLELGSDDYLPKPCNPRELVARIRAILRRASADPRSAQSVVTVGEVGLDPGTRTVVRNGENVELTATEFKLLEMLMRSAGVVVTREQLSELILGREFVPFDRSLDVHVSKLRKKLGFDDASDPIKTLRGVGYIFAKPTEDKAPAHGEQRPSPGMPILTKTKD
jgi:DNA-binding response OmpR family regulator